MLEIDRSRCTNSLVPARRRQASVPERFRKLMAKPAVRKAAGMIVPIAMSLLEYWMKRRLGRPSGIRGRACGGERGMRRFRGRGKP